jgi:uncharacterized protein (DUF3820 family)
LKKPDIFLREKCDNKMNPDPNLLIQLTQIQMPFGRYKGTLLCDLPVSFLEWFEQKGFPDGKLGVLLQTIYEIKLNGLEYLLEPLRKKRFNR